MIDIASDDPYGNLLSVVQRHRRLKTTAGRKSPTLFKFHNKIILLDISCSSLRRYNKRYWVYTMLNINNVSFNGERKQRKEMVVAKDL